MQRRYGLAGGLLCGVAVDAVLGDPRRRHPVAAFGRGAAMLERRLYADSRWSGAIFAALCAGSSVALGIVIDRRSPSGVRYVVAVALATWAVVGAESLDREARSVQQLLDDGDLGAAREQLTHLVGRDPSQLDGSEIARAAIESVAENTSDALLAPLLWGAVAGVPGLLGYRAVNTLDAMVGHRNPRYERFGWAAARTDDVANLVPARVTAVMVGLVSGCPIAVGRVVARDARRHPSPNAGWCEAAFAGALDLRLGGMNRYGDRLEDRPRLGDGRTPERHDLARARALARRVSIAGTAAAALLSVALRSDPRAEDR
ncbi:MAG: cobalamin biosynthesis protein [Actinomycetota bacterium]|nr:cobalamin biosynthesis protein [Actinomycetota bacterium]